MKKFVKIIISWYLSMCLCLNLAYALCGPSDYARKQRNGLVLFELTGTDFTIYSPFSNDHNDIIFNLCYAHDNFSQWHIDFN